MAATASFPWPFAGAGTELGLLFENAPAGIAQCDREGTILAMNPALSAMLGSRLRAIKHPRFCDLVLGQDRERSVGMFRQLMSGEQASFQLENQFDCSEGEPIWLRWSAWGVCGSAHNPDCVLLLAEDITVRRRQEERALQTDRLQALGRMAGGIAHDFNNLLTGILLYCDLMLSDLGVGGIDVDKDKDKDIDKNKNGPRYGGLPASSPVAFPGQDRLRKYAQEIRSAGVQASGMVQQLLTVTRPGTVNPHPVSLNAVTEEMRNLLLRLMGENVELSFCLDADLGLVKIDPAQAQQILLNLVLNARDALPEGGRIQVETGNCSVQIFRDVSGESAGASESCVAPAEASPTIPCVLFTVTDNGGGMNEETRQRAFQAYFTTKEEGRGGGLGLATVHNIVAGRGGLVQVESAPGRGTRVIVLLPAVSSSEISVKPIREAGKYR
jgi:two-component system cell cycle sensor histidine kinase/response regulator CckA